MAPGTKLGRFVVQKLLGAGSFSAVYLAEDAVRSEVVALKLMAVKPVDPGVAAAQLQQEREVHDRVQDHRHVLRVHDLHMVNYGALELLVLSMEYADGGTFRRWLTEHDWQTRRSEGVEYFKQICLGVGALHESGIVHGDIKPENFLLVDGVVKVADLGFSACAQDLTLGPVSHRHCHCEYGCGTPAYMSPAHFAAAHRDDLDLRADIYSLGVVLHEILHPKCRPPFGGTYAQLRDRHLNVPAPALQQAAEAEARVVGRCLEKNPDDRYQDVHQLLDDLEGRNVPAPVDDGETDSDLVGQVDSAWQQVCDRFAGQCFAEAASLCRRIVQACPDHADAQEMLEQIQHRHSQAEQLYTAISQGLDDRGLDDMNDLLSEAVAVYPEHPSGLVVQVRLAAKARQYRQAMEQGLAAAQDGDLEAALASLERARQLNPGTRATEEPVRLVGALVRNIQERRQQIDAAMAAENWDLAQGLARELDQYIQAIIDAITSNSEESAA
ncbi:MAG: protein kinase [Pseudomonadota bacterium]